LSLEGETGKLTGHETSAMFERYDITDNWDTLAAGRRPTVRRAAAG
jgi:hypothetical protein